MLSPFLRRAHHILLLACLFHVSPLPLACRACLGSADRLCRGSPAPRPVCEEHLVASESNGHPTLTCYAGLRSYINSRTHMHICAPGVGGSWIAATGTRTWRGALSLSLILRGGEASISRDSEREVSGNRDDGDARGKHYSSVCCAEAREVTCTVETDIWRQDSRRKWKGKLLPLWRTCARVCVCVCVCVCLCVCVHVCVFVIVCTSARPRAVSHSIFLSFFSPSLAVSRACSLILSLIFWQACAGVRARARSVSFAFSVSHLHALSVLVSRSTFCIKVRT